MHYTVMASRTHVQRVRMLYKTILRLHRGLPIEVRPLGDGYVRDEFRRHKRCIESEAIIFLHEWTVSKFASFVNRASALFEVMFSRARRDVVQS